jgi:hypothetical protein
MHLTLSAIDNRIGDFPISFDELVFFPLSPQQREGFNFMEAGLVPFTALYVEGSDVNNRYDE